MRKLFGKIFVSDDASIVRERDFFVLVDAGCEPKTRGDFIHLCRQTKKPISYAFITHNHWDHTHNLSYFRKMFPKMKVIRNSRRGSEMVIQKEESMFLGDSEYVVIPTPGHSPGGDDICIYLPDKKTVFVGDLCQPQGPSYEKTDFATPVPYFHLGEEYINSLKKIISLKTNHIITGHGIIYRKRALEVTLEVAERIRDIAKEEVRKNPFAKNSLLCKTIFERVCWERNFHNPEQRMRDPYFRDCDIPGIMYWVRKFKKE
ncbi:MAG: MBL fold metallo-hydrolase [Candidatus Aenigmatarchaeota archaeon]